MDERMKPSDPRLFQVTLIPKLDESDEGKFRQATVRDLVAQMILLGKQRGRPRKQNESDDEQESE